MDMCECLPPIHKKRGEMEELENSPDLGECSLNRMTQNGRLEFEASWASIYSLALLASPLFLRTVSLGLPR